MEWGTHKWGTQLLLMGLFKAVCFPLLVLNAYQVFLGTSNSSGGFQPFGLRRLRTYLLVSLALQCADK